ncbi:S41 family peptidase [Alteromonas sp. BMJM2]|uniref:S41 family peptidase n=1 Tax=Alteromonas sp. BMJM2 TaxID=2954241 RepID=UPI0022B4E6E4|nr:S41 family peptidase [Alteromonas sp. BMJM2]
MTQGRFVRNLIISLLLIPSMTFADNIDNSRKAEILSNLKQEISEQYIIEDSIPGILASLDSLSSTDFLVKLPDGNKFAEVINEKLKQFDRHFSLSWSNPNEISTKPRTESYWDRLDRKNSGFSKVEILEGNIGYIEFWGFDRVNVKSEQRVANVMSFISETDAIIFDLRNNGGGSPRMIQLLSGYLFNERTQLSSIYWRNSDETEEFWTSTDIRGKKRPTIPIYVLTSNDTFSAAEAFTYDLKSLKRATIVGETTGGGANPMRFVDFGDGFIAGIPYGRAINPITKTNWEWVGVTPDIETSREQALETAYISALNTLLNVSRNDSQKIEIKNKLKDLTAH